MLLLLTCSSRRILDPQLLFTTGKNGYRLATMLDACKSPIHPVRPDSVTYMSGKPNTPAILLVKDKQNSRFGVFSYAGFARTKRNIDGRSFIFTLSPELVCYPAKLDPEQQSNTSTNSSTASESKQESKAL